MSFLIGFYGILFYFLWWLYWHIKDKEEDAELDRNFKKRDEWESKFTDLSTESSASVIYGRLDPKEFSERVRAACPYVHDDCLIIRMGIGEEILLAKEYGIVEKYPEGHWGVHNNRLFRSICPTTQLSLELHDVYLWIDEELRRRGLSDDFYFFNESAKEYYLIPRDRHIIPEPMIHGEIYGWYLWEPDIIFKSRFYSYLTVPEMMRYEYIDGEYKYFPLDDAKKE